MIFKKGVNPIGIRNELMIALIVADRIWIAYKSRLVITSLNDGKHSKTSLHYSGQAADFRIWAIDSHQLADELSKALGNNPDYDVVVEKDHIHLEWQPKRK